ncbi:MAG TPA: hypothetical protein PLB54_09970, partial [Nitrosomonas sp.]|nr:hypothetical protein [Nitrosomonas sp.]
REKLPVACLVHCWEEVPRKEDVNHQKTLSTPVSVVCSTYLQKVKENSLSEYVLKGSFFKQMDRYKLVS